MANAVRNFRPSLAAGVDREPGGSSSCEGCPYPGSDTSPEVARSRQFHTLERRDRDPAQWAGNDQTRNVYLSVEDGGRSAV